MKGLVYSLCIGYAAAQAPDLLCSTIHCGVQVGACALDGGCRDAMSCAGNCPTVCEDMSAGKLDYQNCTLQCSYAFGYGDSAYTNVITCLNEHQCLTLPSINDPPVDPWFNQWLADDEIHPVKQLSIDDLSGSEGWWAAIGFHPIYDCAWPCQWASMNYDGTQYNWDLHMEVDRGVNGGLLAIHEIWPFPAQSGTQFWLNHTDLGMLHYEHWTLLDKADDGSWVALYYRGGTGTWKYSGGIVFSRARELTAEQRATVTATYQSAVGWDVDAQGCTFDNSQCTTPDVTV